MAWSIAAMYSDGSVKSESTCVAVGGTALLAQFCSAFHPMLSKRAIRPMICMRTDAGRDSYRVKSRTRYSGMKSEGDYS